MSTVDPSTSKHRRKTMMLGEEAHAQISAMAEAHNLSQPEVIDALLTALDQSAFELSVERLAGQRRVRAEERRHKREIIDAATANLSAQELENLLRQLVPQATSTPPQGE